VRPKAAPASDSQCQNLPDFAASAESATSTLVFSTGQPAIQSSG